MLFERLVRHGALHVKNRFDGALRWPFHQGADEFVPLIQKVTGWCSHPISRAVIRLFSWSSTANRDGGATIDIPSVGSGVTVYA